MGWEEIIERLHVSGKLTAARVDKAKTKGLITATQAKDIKAKKKEGVSKDKEKTANNKKTSDKG